MALSGSIVARRGWRARRQRARSRFARRTTMRVAPRRTTARRPAPRRDARGRSRGPRARARATRSSDSAVALPRSSRSALAMSASAARAPPSPGGQLLAARRNPGPSARAAQRLLLCARQRTVDERRVVARPAHALDRRGRWAVPSVLGRRCAMATWSLATLISPVGCRDDDFAFEHDDLGQPRVVVDANVELGPSRPAFAYGVCEASTSAGRG